MITIDTLIRARRKSIGLMVTRDAKLVVRAPHWMSVQAINDLVSQKQRWIDTKKEFFRNKPAAKPKHFVDGEKFLFLGREYPLRIVEDLPQAVVLGDNALMLHQAVVPHAADHILIWYQNQAGEHIAQRVRHYAAQTGLDYKNVRVNDARTRWGSCGPQNGLNFTWRLIMAPARVVDYVVIHELMHIKQKNHSRKFWDEVRMLVPDHKQDELWLKHHGHQLSFNP